MILNNSISRFQKLSKVGFIEFTLVPLVVDIQVGITVIINVCIPKS